MKQKSPSRKKNAQKRPDIHVGGDKPRTAKITKNHTEVETGKPKKLRSEKIKIWLTLLGVIIPVLGLVVAYKQLEHAWTSSEPAIGAKYIRLVNFDVRKMFQVELTLENTGNSTAENVQALSSLAIRDVGSQLGGYPVTNPSTGPLGAKKYHDHLYAGSNFDNSYLGGP